MIEIEKSRKKSLVVFKDVAEKNSPFRKGPSHSQNKQRGGGRYCYAGEPGNRDQHNGRFNNQYGRFQDLFKNNSGRKFQYGSSATQGKYLFGSFHQQLKTGTTGINDFDTSSSKKIIYPRNTRCTTGRKAISVGKTVEKNYTRPRNFVNSEGVSDTIHKSPSSGEASKYNKNVRTTVSASGPGNIRVAGEGSYSESRNSSRGVSEQPFTCWNGGWGKPSVDKSEKTQCIHPLRALQNGRFALSKISSGRKRFPVQDRYQRRLRCNSSQQTVITSHYEATSTSFFTFVLVFGQLQKFLPNY